MATAKKCVLIVDDEAFNISVLVELLKGDYQTLAAKDGEQALRRAKGELRPDLILLDVMMPDMDGYEVCRRLKRDPAIADIPVIFVTARSAEDDETMGLSLGAVDYITKPIAPAIVRARVRTHLELVATQQDIKEKNRRLVEEMEIREDIENIMRHDLKGPLTPIIGLASLMLEVDQVEGKARNRVSTILDSGYRILDMVNMSLDLVKMERGVYELRAEVVDLVGVLDNILDEVENIAAAKDTKIDVSQVKQLASGARLLVWGAKPLLYSLLSNLVRNALEAIPEGGEVSLEVTSDHKMVAARLRNIGEVPLDIRDRFFEKYATSGKDYGTGLGTYSARLMARAQGGDISLDTSEKGFTTIEIKLSKPKDGPKDE